MTALYLLPGMLAAQTATYSWSGYTTGASSYTTGIMTSTVTYTSVSMQYSTPRYFAAATVGSGQCGQAGGLALECLFGNITNAAVNLSMDFTNGGTQNGTCASIKFIIKDINADESVQTFADWVEISALDASNTAVPVASIVVNLGTSCSQTTSGTTRIIKGYSGSYGSRSSTACNTTTVTVTPPVGVPLKSINLKYHPDYTACASCYYNWTGPNRPAYQYISIGQLDATTTTPGGCVVTVLPVELVSFSGKCEEDGKEFEWQTASEKNSDYFMLGGSNNGIDFTELGRIKASGNSQFTKHYKHIFETSETDYRYFRLSQSDRNGEIRDLRTISLSCGGRVPQLVPNPAHDMVEILASDLKEETFRVSVTNSLGKEVRRFLLLTDNLGTVSLDIAELPGGVYQLIILSDDDLPLYKPLKLVKQQLWKENSG